MASTWRKEIEAQGANPNLRKLAKWIGNWWRTTVTTGTSDLTFAISIPIFRTIGGKCNCESSIEPGDEGFETNRGGLHSCRGGVWNEGNLGSKGNNSVY